ncbi:MAG TPA: isoprenylcysteine carboxylmethyltransferase family protein [candidate division Zixibacteria bacterium]|nr:isoprenylcysteine carboxylmethyltransferase family protein [candidate division Zixibacteria bacterium]
MSEPATNASPPDRANVVGLPPLYFIAALLIGLMLERRWPLYEFPDFLRHLFSWPLLALSLGLAGSAFYQMMRAGTAIDPHKPTTALVTSGPYRFSRNPMYLSLALLVAGVAFFRSSLWTLLLLVPAVLLLERLVIRREERYLETKFGENYREYRARVRRWL